MFDFYLFYNLFDYLCAVIMSKGFYFYIFYFKKIVFRRVSLHID